MVFPRLALSKLLPPRIGRDGCIRWALLMLAVVVVWQPVQAQHLRLDATAAAARKAVLAATPQIQRPAASHYNVVVLRVAFQADDNRFTTGDGTFTGDLYRGLKPTVDPLPHDAAYFEAHLAFLEHYMARVSDGKTQVRTHLIPDVVTVSQPMGAYSPTGPDAGSDAELARLAALVAEAWTLADQNTTFSLDGFDPATTAFMLFHAGVGRDVELVGTTLDKTPQDLPSLYFGPEALERLVGQPIAFKGQTVRNTMILPRTETRKGFNFITDEDFLAEISINGLLAASFFNYLGVPDLFDTATGQSAIGPFGLMDALGIFAYSGLFPPEPSAWTKAYLGWADLIPLTGDGPENVTLRHGGAASSSDVAMASHSAAEYFLVENRQRDPEEDGLVLQVWREGRVEEVRFQNGDQTFNSFTIEGFGGGVVVAADQYDWALPGGLDEDGNTLNGGILVWHVDERRLAEGLPTNSVNADPERRAIDLEEADSAQDLGYPQGGLFGPQNDLGSPFDFYYRGNPVVVISRTGQEISLYKNRFGPDTFPNSQSNEGGAAFITLEAFSLPRADMTFTYRRDAALGIKPAFSSEAPGYFGPSASVVAALERGADHRRFVQRGEDVLIWAFSDDEPGIQTLARRPSLTRPLWRRRADSRLEMALMQRVADKVAVELLPEDAFLDDQRERRTLVVDGTEGYTPQAAVVVVDEGLEAVYALLTSGTDAALLRVIDEDSLALTPLPAGTQDLATLEGQPVWLTSTDVHSQDGRHQWTHGLPSPATGGLMLGRDAQGVVAVLPDASQAVLALMLHDGAVRHLTVAGSGDLTPAPVLVDLDGDHHLDVLVSRGHQLWAYTQAGAVVSGFPIPLPAPALAQPLVAMLTESGGQAIILASTDGYVYAYDLGMRGEQVPGFPLPVGRRLEATPMLAGHTLTAVSTTGDVASWTLEGVGEIWWGERFGDPANSRYNAHPVPLDLEAPARLLNVDETYNWPNPIRDGSTHLRLAVARDASVRITIIDAAGSLVDDIRLEDIPPRVPVEYRWTTSAPSGVYYARVVATAFDGTRDTHLIKMAVIR